MKDTVLKVAEMLNVILIKSGVDARKNAILDSLRDFRISTLNEIQHNYDDNDDEELIIIRKLSKQIEVYTEIENAIKDNSIIDTKISTSISRSILLIYDYYEYKYIEELQFRNTEQRKKYIETILSPLLLIHLYINDLKNKLKAFIFQKHIINKSETSDFIESFNGCYVEINDKKFSVFNGEIKLFETVLNFRETDLSTTTYIGNYNENVLRFIRPNYDVLINITKKYDCESAFSISSDQLENFAIHFILTESENNNFQTIEKNRDDLMQKLIDGCFFAIENKLFKDFHQLSKRLLSLIKDYNSLDKYRNGPELLKIIIQNFNLYSKDEQDKLLPF